MGIFQDDPVATNDPSRLGDLMTAQVNTAESKRAFARYHEFDPSGANNGKHRGISYFHQPFNVKLPTTSSVEVVLDTANSELFEEGVIWRCEVFYEYTVVGLLLSGLLQAHWAGTHATSSWNFLSGTVPNKGGAEPAFTNQALVDSTDPLYGFSGSMATIGVLSTPALKAYVTGRQYVSGGVIYDVKEVKGYVAVYRLT